jgi:hypothetical protein
VTDRQLVVVAAVFAVFLTACDQLFHVRTDTLAYHWDPKVADQTVIVPFTFFLAGVAMLDLSRRLQPQRVTPVGTWHAAASLGVVTAAYLVSGLLGPDLAAAYAMVLFVLWGVRVVLRHERAAAVVVCLVVATGGVLAESALSAAGEFDYLAPDILGVPWWLFPLYLHGALVAADVVALVTRSSTDHAVRPRTTGRS